MNNNDGAWFAPKTFGYGAGLPIAWQGWVLMAFLVAVLTGLALALMPGHPGYFAIAAFGITVMVMPLMAMKTRGGWKWRNGK